MTISELTSKYILEEFVRADGSVNEQGELFIPVPRCPPGGPGKSRFGKRNGVLVEEVINKCNGQELMLMKHAPELLVLGEFPKTFGAFRFVYESKKAMYVELWMDGVFKTVKTADMSMFRIMLRLFGQFVWDMPAFAQAKERAVAADGLPDRVFCPIKYYATPSWPFCDDMSWAISDWWKYGLLPEGEHLVYKATLSYSVPYEVGHLLLWHVAYVPVHHEPMASALKDPGELAAKLGAKMPVVAAARLGEYAEKTMSQSMCDPNLELFIVKAVPSQVAHAIESSRWKMVRHKDKCLHRDGKFKAALNNPDGQSEGTDK